MQYETAMEWKNDDGEWTERKKVKIVDRKEEVTTAGMRGWYEK